MISQSHCDWLDLKKLKFPVFGRKNQIFLQKIGNEVGWSPMRTSTDDDASPGGLGPENNWHISK